MFGATGASSSSAASSHLDKRRSSHSEGAQLWRSESTVGEIVQLSVFGTLEDTKSARKDHVGLRICHLRLCQIELGDLFFAEGSEDIEIFFEIGLPKSRRVLRSAPILFKSEKRARKRITNITFSFHYTHNYRNPNDNMIRIGMEKRLKKQHKTVAQCILNLSAILQTPIFEPTEISLWQVKEKDRERDREREKERDKDKDKAKEKKASKKTTDSPQGLIASNASNLYVAPPTVPCLIASLLTIQGASYTEDIDSPQDAAEWEEYGSQLAIGDLVDEGSEDEDISIISEYEPETWSQTAIDEAVVLLQQNQISDLINKSSGGKKSYESEDDPQPSSSRGDRTAPSSSSSAPSKENQSSTSHPAPSGPSFASSSSSSSSSAASAASAASASASRREQIVHGGRAKIQRIGKLLNRAPRSTSELASTSSTDDDPQHPYYYDSNDDDDGRVIESLTSTNTGSFAADAEQLIEPAFDNFYVLIHTLKRRGKRFRSFAQSSSSFLRKSIHVQSSLELNNIFSQIITRYVDQLGQSTQEQLQDLKVMLVGNDAFVHYALRNFSEHLSKKSRLWVLDRCKFFLVPVGAGIHNEIALQISSRDETYRNYFYSSEWQDFLDRSDDLSQQQKEEIEKKILRYVEESEHVYKFSLSEAFITQLDPETQSQKTTKIPFLKSFQIGVHKQHTPSSSAPSSAGPSMSHLPVAEVASETIEQEAEETANPSGADGAESDVEVPHTAPPSSSSSSSSASASSHPATGAKEETVSDVSGFDLHIDYWVPKKKGTDAHQSNIKALFHFVGTSKLSTICQQSFRVQDPLLLTSSSSTLMFYTEFKQKQRALSGKQVVRQKTVITKINKLVCVPSKDSGSFSVLIDDVEWTRVKFVSISPQWGTQVKFFPIACFQSPPSDAPSK